MNRSTGRTFVLLLGGLCAVAGIAAWIVLGWKALAEIDGIEAHSAAGGRLIVWGLTGTLLMIAGSVILHIAQPREDQEQ